MKSILFVLLSLVMLGLASAATAAEDPTGTWKWSAPGRNQQTREVSVTLKLEGDKLTGTLPGRDGKEVAIEEGTFKDDQVSFSVTREREGRKFVQKFSGKVSGDTIKGKIEFGGEGKTNSRDWEAKRSK
ncbi:MAG: hypothetical protein ACO1RA_04970 [Planctomycetaceae bacterium]